MSPVLFFGLLKIRAACGCELGSPLAPAEWPSRMAAWEREGHRGQARAMLRVRRVPAREAQRPAHRGRSPGKARSAASTSASGPSVRVGTSPNRPEAGSNCRLFRGSFTRCAKGKSSEACRQAPDPHPQPQMPGWRPAPPTPEAQALRALWSPRRAETISRVSLRSSLAGLERQQ